VNFTAIYGGRIQIRGLAVDPDTWKITREYPAPRVYWDVHDSCSRRWPSSMLQGPTAGANCRKLHSSSLATVIILNCIVIYKYHILCAARNTTADYQHRLVIKELRKRDDCRLFTMKKFMNCIHFTPHDYLYV